MSRSSPLSSTARKLEFLSRRATYPGQTQPVEVIETHFAWVFLAERYAYKMKKALRQDVMDYRSVASRARGCRNELRLNRRLAPGVYLEALPLRCLRDGSLILGVGGGRIVDWLIRMRRLPATRMLDLAITQNAVTARDRHALVNLLSRFYARARPRAMSSARYVRLFRARLEENLSALSASGTGLGLATLARVAKAQRLFIDSNSGLLGARAQHLVEAHGDLRPEHIYLGSRLEGPCVIDCLEFDARLRRLDPVEELAFLCLECRRLGAEAFGRGVTHAVLAKIGAEVPPSLISFYTSHRALIRAKLCIWHLRGQRRPRAANHWRERASSYIEEALHFAVLALRPPRAARGDRTTSKRYASGHPT